MMQTNAEGVGLAVGPTLADVKSHTVMLSGSGSRAASGHNRRTVESTLSPSTACSMSSSQTSRGNVLASQAQRADKVERLRS